MSPVFAIVTAYEIRVGGASSSPYEPSIEPLIPVAPIPRSIWALNAPSIAASGLPHLTWSSPGAPKRLLSERYTSLNLAPLAISLDTDSITARYAP